MRPYLDDAGTLLRKRIITDCARWTALYAERIPVVTLDDHVILEGRPDEDEVVAAMEAAGLVR